MNVLQIITNSLNDNLDNLPQNIRIKRYSDSNQKELICHNTNKLFALFHEDYENSFFGTTILGTNILVYKNIVYIGNLDNNIVYEPSDLEDAGIMFNLSLMLSTSRYETLLIAKSLIPLCKSTFILFTDNIKYYSDTL